MYNETDIGDVLQKIKNIVEQIRNVWQEENGEAGLAIHEARFKMKFMKPVSKWNFTENFKTMFKWENIKPKAELCGQHKSHCQEGSSEKRSVWGMSAFIC